MNEPGGPPPSLVVTLAALTVVSGFVDAVSFLGLGHVFTANMTGNVVLIGFAVAGAPGFSLAASLCALACFLAGAVAGGRIIKVGSARTALLVAMVIETGGVTAAALVASLVVAVGTGWPRYVVIGLLAASMGVRNAVVRHLGVPEMPTAVLTTTLTGLASNSVLAGGSDPHARLGATTVVSMFAGALVGAVLLLHAGAAWSLGVAAILAAAAAAFFSREAPLELGLAT